MYDLIPAIVRNRSRYYRLGYLVINLLSTVLTYIGQNFVLENWKIFWTLNLASTFSFYLVQGSDPGYLDEFDIPFNQAHICEEIIENVENNSNDVNSNNSLSNMRTAQSSQLIFCRFCDKQMPIRSHHCRQCDKCVATFDHHCPVIGTCIGERNQSRFWWFLFTHFLGLLLLVSIQLSTPTHSFLQQDIIVSKLAKPYLSSSALHHQQQQLNVKLTSTTTLAASQQDPHKSLRNIMFYIFTILLIYCALILAPQTWFAVSSMSGYECGKGSYRISYMRGFDDFDFPFSSGLFGNLFGFCCVRDDSGCYSTNNMWTGIVRWWYLWIPPGSAFSQYRRPMSPRNWRPFPWQIPDVLVRDGELCDNLWQNKYYSCC